MSTEEIEMLIAAGRENYLSLLDEATALLRNLDTYSPEAMGEAMQRRQHLVGVLQVFDTSVRDVLDVENQCLADFRGFQEEITRKILEVDGLVIALTREKQTAIKCKLSTMSKSMTASHAYEYGGATPSGGLDNSA